MKKTLTLFILNLVAISYGQQNFVLAGGQATGSGGSVSYSYGQMFYEPINGSNGELTQGVQQAIEIYPLSTPSNTIAINVTLYPNPAVAQVMLDLNFSHFQEDMKYEIFSLDGRLIKIGSILSNQTNIDVDILPAATYFLNVISSNKIIKAFRLIKNN